MVKPPEKTTRAWAELVRTGAALLTLAMQGTLLYLWITRGA